MYDIDHPVLVEYNANVMLVVGLEPSENTSIFLWKWDKLKS